MNKKKALNFIPMGIGLMLIIFAPMLGNNVELHSIYEDVTRSYFTYIAYTISFSILGLAIFLLGVIGYYMGNKR
ncbi:hypothetical protein M2651_00195 [Clostridium sp. SYSU_GA19001]|uniref:hypothetical protein n=1 Tax=Clostridium caldaquaticum TaxID=2940653 RepID=UPI0020772149|nr:hypothetical protein [Clostridium caldaquaticum]MCM8709444.1 hypothetical protein [Clostridium caldaquaticum]